MKGYYTRSLSGERLKRCYDLATPGIRKYLDDEINFLMDRIEPHHRILEMGCGYGRVMMPLAAKAAFVAGIDLSDENISYGMKFLARMPNTLLMTMDACNTAFHNGTFDLTFCIQNGICAFGETSYDLLRECLRVTRPGGKVVLSSYSESMWPERLRWFELQSAEGLVGPVDHTRTRKGVIVCNDGFRVGTFTPDRFRDLAASFRLQASVIEYARSTVMCEIRLHG
ncbi:MAG: class I SAM-dependent methyltransferase [Bacteroidales bacterium]|nr:class I SAM-dependent methyltransferase [Bacteroidales bacterium]